MEYIIGGLWSGLELLASLFFSGAFLSRREKKWYQPLLFLSAWIFVCVYTNLELNRIIMQTLSIMVYAALSCVVHDGKWYLHILLALISYLFLLITDALVVNGMCALLHLSYNQLMERMWLFITLTTIDKTIAVFFGMAAGKDPASKRFWQRLRQVARSVHPVSIGQHAALCSAFLLSAYR